MIGCLSGTTVFSPQSFSTLHRQGCLSQLVRVLFAFSGPGDVMMATSADWWASYQMIHQIRFHAESVGLAADYRTVRGQSTHSIEVWLFYTSLVYLSVEHTGALLAWQPCVIIWVLSNFGKWSSDKRLGFRRAARLLWDIYIRNGPVPTPWLVMEVSVDWTL